MSFNFAGFCVRIDSKLFIKHIFSRAGQFYIVLALLAFIASPNLSSAKEFTEYDFLQTDSGRNLPQSQQDNRIDLQSDSLVYDEENQILIAEGNVEMVQGVQILTTDRLEYNLKTDVAKAVGNVALLQESGDIHFAQELEFHQKLKEGVVQGLYSYLAQDARLTAESGEQVDGGQRVVMHNAAYTPCIPCQKKKDQAIRDQILTDETPAWEIKANQVIHDKEAQTVIYKNARFNFQGIPVFYTPYFSHPDGTVQQKSGFLTPLLGFDSELGANFTSRYYWAIDEHQDATIGVLASTEENPVLLGDYRRRFNNAYIELSGSATSSDRIDLVDGIAARRDESFRGHLFGEGLWDINDKWRAGFDIELTSDDQYLREYNITGEDVLETEAYIERFDQRDYFSIRGFGFQDTRIFAEDIDQPNIIPEISYSALGDPGSFLGGRLSLDASILGLRRAGDGQDLTRGLIEAGWRKFTVLPLGLVSDTHLTLRGDAFNVRDRDAAQINPNLDDTENEGRLFAQIHNVIRYPLVKALQNASILIEPIVALTLAPDINQQEDSIPNEDSQDIQLDISGLFANSRFPGDDRIEDNSRITYGINAGYYFYEGSFLRTFLGQSYSFEADDVQFPEGSGLSDQSSDLVGRIGVQYKDNFDFDYSFQFDNDNLQSQRHELTSSLSFDRWAINTRYFFSRGLANTAVDDGREQLRLNSFLWLDDERQWRGRSGMTYDFGEDEGLRQAFLGLDFTNDCGCWSVGMTAVRNLTNEASGEGSTEFLIQVAFKNLGAFGNSDLGLD